MQRMQRGQNNAKLSQSALSYLQSLEQNTKALQQSLTEKRNSFSRKESDGGSLLSMISQMRKSQSKNDSEEESLEHQSSFLHNSLSDLSEESGERVLLGLPGEDEQLVDLNSSITSSTHFLPRPISDKSSRKSITEMRELRNSIDLSLIKPPKLEKRTSGLNILKKDEKTDKDKVVHPMEKISEEQKLPQTVKKSAFKGAIESGSSDAESIDFEAPVSGNVSSVRFEDEEGKKDSTNRSSVSSDSKHSSSNSSPQSDSSSASSSSGSSNNSSRTSTGTSESSTVIGSAASSSRSSSRRSSSRSKKEIIASSTVIQEMSLEPVDVHVDDGYEEDFEEEEGSNREMKKTKKPSSRRASEDRKNERRSRADNAREKSEKKRRMSREKRKSKSQTDIRLPKSLEDNPEGLSLILNLLIKEVMDTHLSLLRDFHEMEWQTTNRWRKQLEEMKREYEGRRMRELEYIMGVRVSHTVMQKWVALIRMEYAKSNGQERPLLEKRIGDEEERSKKKREQIAHLNETRHAKDGEKKLNG
ncbi:hypothetical protein WR25_20501 [Diploscapter pachys]|uniref:Uncharacterized protein n=1 Tax=Diploscapter pachys TaxID=2018661 RepID=A0A2A2JS23_9BILA|nr:hypothetical protein WR25_20501 [Diploscapter pachys]